MSNIFGVQVAGGIKLIEEGDHDAVLHAIIENGIQKRAPYNGAERKPAKMIRFVFEIPALKSEEGQHQFLGKEVAVSMTEKSHFYNYLKNMGVLKEPTKEEVERSFGTREQVEAVLGTVVSLTVAHFDKKDGTKGHCIKEVSKLDPRLPQPVAEAEPYIFAFNEPDLDVFKNKLGKYGREKIMHALNVKDLPKEFHEAYIAEQEANGGEAPAKPKADTKNAKGVI